jgi:signal transduction histidine kinase
VLRRLRFRVSRAQKFVFWTIVGVVLPVGVLAFLHYNFLANLEGGTQAAVRHNLEQTLQAATTQAQSDMESLGRAVLLPMERLDIDGEPSDVLENRLAEILDLHPQIQQLFLIRQSCTREGTRNSGFLYSRQGMQRLAGPQVADDGPVGRAIASYNHAVMTYHALGAAEPAFLFSQHSCPMCRRMGPAAAALYIFHSSGAASMPSGNFSGVMLDAAYMRSTYLSRLTSSLLGRSTQGRFQPVIAVLDQDQHEIFSSGSAATFEVEASFAPVFPEWRLAIGFPNQTLQSLARESFLRTLLITGIVLAVLIAGLYLMLRATAQEIKLAEAKAAFVSNVSHELQTPLSLIQLLSETLKLGRVADEVKSREYYEMIHRESCRLGRLIDNILDFSKIEAGRNEYKFAPGDVGVIVGELLDTYGQQIRNQGFELAIEIEGHLPPVEIDSGAIARAVLNLLDNAMKYSPAVKNIAVRVRQRENAVAIEIADRGIGIARGEQKKIFEKFYRAGSELVHDTKGAGLGLALVKHIVKAHGGSINVESTPGRGSTFTILLPTVAAPVPVPGGYELAKSSDC